MTFVDSFLCQAARTPNAPAVRDESCCLTYRELADRTAALSSLMVEKGLLPGDVVGVLLPRTCEIVVASVAVMRAGGVYMPIDPSYPQERREYMLKDSLAAFLYTSDGLESLSRTRAGALSTCALTPDSPAYLLYTSGTTGNPKGVLHTHRSLLAMATQRHACPLDSTGVVAGFTFIASAFMMFPPLLTGGVCNIVPESAKSDVRSLHDYVVSEGIRQLFLPASLAATMAEEFALDGVVIFSAGEKLRNFKPRGLCRIVNSYGSTEGGGVLETLLEEVQGDEIDIPVGRPFEGITVRLVDENMADVPDGEAGELVYSGDIMAERYVNLDEQTRAKWFESGLRRWFRTGDRMKKTPDGSYICLGRMDNMVKIRGFRVETGEVESRIRLECARILEAVVVLKAIHGIDHLCCYYTSSSPVDEDALRAGISRSLAAYMIPDFWTRLDEFPRNANGKILRGSLPAPHERIEALSALYSELELRVEEAARTVLGLDAPVDIDESFLSLGGDSLRAMKLSSVLCEQGIRVSGSQILKLKYLRKIAAAADVAYERFWTAQQYAAARSRFASWGENILGVRPLSCGQDDMLYSELFFPDCADSRSVYVLPLESEIGADELASALGKVAAGNEDLRAAVVYRGVSVFQQVITDRTLPSSVVDLSADPDGLAAIYNRLKIAPVDPERTPALEVVFAKTAEGQGSLLVRALLFSLGIHGVRRAILAILNELGNNHPDDAALAEWKDLLGSVPDARPAETPAGASRVQTGIRIPHDEIAVYSNHPGKKSVVFVHTGNTGSDAYYQLADRIGDACSFSVIEPYNLYNPQEAIDGIRAIASKYVEILLHHQSEGPYFLGGWCYGGVVAQEMACQMEAAGLEVRSLVMLDSHAIPDRETRELFLSYTSGTGRDYFETSPLFADLRNQGLLESVVANAARVSRNLSAHEPKVFHGPVTYFKPQVTPSGLGGKSLEYWQEMSKRKAGGYETFCPDLRVVTTPHEHDLMMDPESLAIIVPEIMKLID